jgi:NADH:ubiquinone oxidoreductase subunit E
MSKDRPAATAQVEAPPIDLSLLPPVLARYPRRADELIPLLRGVQDCYGYIPQATLEPVARHLLVSRAKVLGVATFYGNFSLVPQGKHKVCVCQGTACHVRGGEQVLAAVSQELGLAAGETTADMRFTLQTVACLGACALAPLMKVDEKYYGKTSPRKAVSVLRTYQQEPQ